MIKSSELRIGNLLFYKNTRDIAKVELIHLKHFDCRDEYGSFTPNGNYEPIPLSEEIFLKVSFDKKAESSGYIGYNINDFEIGISDKEFYYSASNREDCGNQPFVEIKYLHQLQNLFYSLCGQELNTSGLTENK